MVCEGDCDDHDPLTYPSAPELCDGRNNDCSHQPEWSEEDGDGDGYLRCEECDDADPEVHPGAVEVCDGIDNDCDGRVDEPDPTCGAPDEDGPVWDDGEVPDDDGDGCACESGRTRAVGGWAALLLAVALARRRYSVSMSR